MKIRAVLQGKTNEKIKKTRKIMLYTVESDSDIINITLGRNVNHK